MKPNTIGVADMGNPKIEVIPNLLDVINLLIAARVGVRQLSWGAVVSSNPRDRERTTQQLKEVAQFLTELLESNGVL